MRQVSKAGRKKLEVPQQAGDLMVLDVAKCESDEANLNIEIREHKEGFVQGTKLA